MSMRSSDGFTIIELMLFLAISAALMVALMVGWSITVNTQSYKDSARSLAQTLQQEYTNTVNVANDRSNDLSCDLSGSTIIMKQGGSDATPIGSSRCVVMGRYIVVDGAKLYTNGIVGYQPASLSANSTDLNAITDYKPTRQDPAFVPDTTYEVSWSTRPYVGAATNTAKVVIVIVRSPLTGTVYTYTKQLTDGSQRPAVADVMSTGTSNGIKICLDPGAPITQGRMAIQIAKNATSIAGIAVLGDKDAACQN